MVDNSRYVYCLMTEAQMADGVNGVKLKGDKEGLFLSQHPTFYRTGKMIGGKELVGVQITERDCNGLMDITETNSIDEAFAELADKVGDGICVCHCHSVEYLKGLYPELAGTHFEMIGDEEIEVKNFNFGWSVVQ